MLQLPEFVSQIEDALSLLSSRTDGVLTEQALSEAKIDKAAFALSWEFPGGAVLSGDFPTALESLRQAPLTSEGIEDFDPPSTLEPYREVEIFLFPYHEDLYITLPGKGMMLLAQSQQLMTEMIDRFLDETNLEESFARLLEVTGPTDFLYLRRVEVEDAPRDDQDSSLPVMYASGGWLDGDHSSSVFIYAEFIGADRAKEAVAEIGQWPLVQGYNSGEDQPIQEIRQEGAAVVAFGVAPNIDLGGWLLGN